MKVRALIRFEDYKEGTMRNVGDVFEVTKERHEEILTKGGAWVEVVEEVAEDVEESVEVVKQNMETDKTKQTKSKQNTKTGTTKKGKA